MRQSVLCKLPVACKGIAVSCKRKLSHLELKKSIAHYMMKNPNSMLSTSCRMVDTRMMKKKNSWWLQGDNISILFLNQHDKNHPHVLRIVVPVFVEIDFKYEFLCVTFPAAAAYSLHGLSQVFFASL